jgi:excisionase family DNA binding protein
MRSIEELKNELLSLQDVCDILKIKPQTLRNWICQGKIACIKMGRSVRFRRSNIELFLKKLDVK